MAVGDIPYKSQISAIKLLFFMNTFFLGRPPFLLQSKLSAQRQILLVTIQLRLLGECLIRRYSLLLD